MKKITLLSIMTATLLLTGCNNSTAKDAAAKASEATTNAIDTAKAKATEAMDAAKAKAAEAAEATKAKAAEAVEAAKAKADEAAAAAKAKAEEAAAAVKEKAAEAVEAAKAKATEAAEATKAKATEAVDTAKAKITEAAAPAADTAQGKALYAKCAGCHGADGQTKALGKSDVIAGMDAATVEEDLKGYKAGTLNKHTMGSLMKGQVASMSDADIQALSAYISTLK